MVVAELGSGCPTSYELQLTPDLCGVWCWCYNSNNWIGLSSILRPRQHGIGYMGGGFYRSKDPTNSIKVQYWRKELQKKQQNTHIR